MLNYIKVGSCSVDDKVLYYDEHACCWFLGIIAIVNHSRASIHRVNHEGQNIGYSLVSLDNYLLKRN